MRFLLDSNVIVALAHTGQSLHKKALKWYASIAPSAISLHTCSIVELGFIRVSVATGLQPDVDTAKTALADLKASSTVPFSLVPDELGAAHLPKFVKRPQDITDGHLCELARKHSLRLVTLDRGIPHALVIR